MRPPGEKSAAGFSFGPAIPFSPLLFRLYAQDLSKAVLELSRETMGVYGRQTELRAKFNAPDLAIRQMGHFQIINLEGQEITVGSMATDEQIAAEINKIRQITEKPNMSVTGYKPGSIRAALDAAKRQAQEELTAAMGTLAEAQTKAAEVPAAIKNVAGQIKREAEDALQEFAEFTNGGPPLDDGK